MQTMKTALTIAGTDPSGGAGIHADLKTFAAHRVYGMGVVTAIVAQNTRGVYAVEPVSPPMIETQLDAVFGDIVPDAVKVGMLGNRAAVLTVARSLRRYSARFVVDPVMASSSGRRLLDTDAETALRDELLPFASLVTPNIPEAEALSGFRITGRMDMERAARKIMAFGCRAVLVKGGHAAGDCDDFLLSSDFAGWFHSPRIPTKNTHGTGCTLSSAIAANLASGLILPDAVNRAKRYLTGALSAGLALGSGPLDHAWATEIMAF
jgi:hydroxymethylpyrimidine kinase/phosphomethylpyrimidine kinase